MTGRVGREGFEPPKHYAPGLQPGPFGRSGTSPYGADGGTRTRNRLFTKQLLCQLSYVGLSGLGAALGRANRVTKYSD